MSSARETTLGGNQWLEESSRLEWGVAGTESGAQQLQRPGQAAPDADNRLAVQLVPMQIRTFVLNPTATQNGATANVAVLSLCLALTTLVLLV